MTNALHFVLAGLFAFSIFSGIHFQLGGADGYGSENQTNLYNQDSFNAGDTSLLIFHVSSGNFTEGEPYINDYAVAFPVVDDFTQFTINASGMALQNFSNVYVWADYHGVVSPIHYYRSSGTQDYFVGSFGLVFQLDSGKIQSVYWDDFGCGECSDNECVQGENCGIQNSDAGGCSSPSDCNILVYMTWLGTGSNGNDFTSSQFRPTRFSQWSFGPMYKAAAGVAATRFFQPNTNQ